MLSLRQFHVDQETVDAALPRFPAWSWRFLNPLCWFYFAGIPVSLLLLSRLFRPVPRGAASGCSSGLPEAPPSWLFPAFAATLLLLNLLYLARGEGERSAMYVLPFAVLPAAHMLDQIGCRARSLGPLAVTLCFLAFQCWFTELFFLTHW